MNPLLRLEKLGQSVWLDSLSRDLLRSGTLKNLMQRDGVTGVTSNPAIFEKAIGGSADYDDDIRRLSIEGKSPQRIYEELAVEDIREAADMLLPVYMRTKRNDGYVSLEVSPLLARNTDGTVDEARRLWAEVGRANVFIKIPGTREGLPAIAQCISEGININVTLLFGLARYREVMDAYANGLEKRRSLGKSLESIRSVASFFLSRIDVLVDEELEHRIAERRELSAAARPLLGRAAVASARIAYQIHKELVAAERFRGLEESGAHRQRLLWASTSTKNKAYSDVKYVEPLIGPETVNTMPMRTIDAYRHHGDPAARLEQDIESERAVRSRLAAVGIDLDDAASRLESEGIEKFAKPFRALMDALARKSAALHAA